MEFMHNHNWTPVWLTRIKQCWRPEMWNLNWTQKIGITLQRQHCLEQQNHKSWLKNWFYQNFTERPLSTQPSCIWSLCIVAIENQYGLQELSSAEDEHHRNLNWMPTIGIMLWRAALPWITEPETWIEHWQLESHYGDQLHLEQHNQQPESTRTLQNSFYQYEVYASSQSFLWKISILELGLISCHKQLYLTKSLRSRLQHSRIIVEH